MVVGMNSIRWVALATAAMLSVSACSARSAAEPDVTVAPPSMGVVPAEYRTPEPTPEPTPTPGVPAGSVIPDTHITAGPTPGTALGVDGRVLRYVPTDPSWSPSCRPLSGGELADLKTYVSTGTTSVGIKLAKGEPVAVDLPEDGWSVLAYWDEWASGEVHGNAAVRGGGKTSGIGAAWPGTHTLGGAAFGDGPQALKAARDCLFGLTNPRADPTDRDPRPQPQE
ncbi:MAG: hypothetical protein Q4G34_11060 [Micrococcus sp.]|nr:hypothetical protein [Micrococcus sp.]